MGVGIVEKYNYFHFYRSIYSTPTTKIERAVDWNVFSFRTTLLLLPLICIRSKMNSSKQKTHFWSFLRIIADHTGKNRVGITYQIGRKLYQCSSEWTNKWKLKLVSLTLDIIKFISPKFRINLKENFGSSFILTASNLVDWNAHFIWYGCYIMTHCWCTREFVRVDKYFHVIISEFSALSYKIAI